MNGHGPSQFKFFSTAALGTAVLFTFFLVYSAPHRVHHLFEDTQKAPCAVYAISKGCHADQTATAVLALGLIALEERSEPEEIWTRSVTLSPFFQRAPPLA